MTEADELAHHCKVWRDRVGLTQPEAAAVLGMPFPTYRGIENGRGFRYPRLLRMTLATLTPGKARALVHQA